ncbi:MAG TPA: recombinase family protein, partial [Solirubrobacterales bacterium]
MNSNLAAKPDTQGTAPPIAVVALGVKSSPDPNDATAAQLAAIDADVDALGGREVVARLSEENVSGWRGDRGPETERAFVEAERLAAEGREVELWVYGSARVGRGSGRKNEARSVLEVYVRLKRAGVRMRSVTDDDFLADETRVAMASAVANKYSEDLSASVKRGKRTQFEERGERLGGPVPDGFLALPRAEGEPRRYAPDPERAPIFERMGELADPQAGALAPANVARRLNAEGYLTKKGRPWDRRRVQDALTNPFYAGMVARGRSTPGAPVETAPASHPAIIDPERFARIQGGFADRDRAAGSNRRGRPNT